MTTPEIVTRNGSMEFAWPDSLIIVTLDRFRDSHERGLHAELTVTTAAPGYSPLLTQTTMNLTPLRSRAEVIKHLDALYPDPDWTNIIQYVCVSAINAQRRGEPVLALTEYAEIDPPTFRVNPFVYDNMPSILFGPGGTGKSVTALFLAMLTECGATAGRLSASPGRTLILDWESDYRDHATRAKQIRAGHPCLLGAEPLYRRCVAPLADDLPAIAKHVGESDVKLLVIDSLALACGGDQDRAESAIRFYAALRTIPVATLIVAHTQKNSETPTVFGSAFFTNLARSVWELKKVQEAGEQMIRVGLYHRKGNLGPLHVPIGLQLDFADAITFTTMDLTKEPSLAQGLPTWQRLAHALKDGLKDTEQLAEEAGTSPSIARARLSEGTGKWCVKVGPKWGLLDHER